MPTATGPGAAHRGDPVSDRDDERVELVRCSDAVLVEDPARGVDDTDAEVGAAEVDRRPSAPSYAAVTRDVRRRRSLGEIEVTDRARCVVGRGGVVLLAPVGPDGLLLLHRLVGRVDDRLHREEELLRGPHDVLGDLGSGLEQRVDERLHRGRRRQARTRARRGPT